MALDISKGGTLKIEDSKAQWLKIQPRFAKLQMAGKFSAGSSVETKRGVRTSFQHGGCRFY
jgi:hypothetical protein